MALRRQSVPPSLGGLPAESSPAPRRYLLPLLGVALCALAALGVLRLDHSTPHPAPAPRAPVLTHATAEAVLAQLWPKREAALANDDEGAISVIDTGAALARDRSNVVEALARGDSGGRPIPPLSLHSVTLGGPITGPVGYPASFLAEVQPRTPPGHEPSTFLLVVTKQSGSAPWRVAMEASRGGTLRELNEELEELGEEELWAPRHRGSSPAWTQPRGALAALAAYFQHYVEYGGPPAYSPFMPGPWTTETGRYLAEHDPRYVVNRNGIRVQSNYTPDWQDGVYTFPAEGLEVTCGTIAVSSVWTPAGPGGFLYQPPSRSNWGAALAPGAYQSIRSSGEHQVCLMVLPAQGKIKVFSGEHPDGGLSAVSGVPVPQMQPEAEPTAKPHSS